MYIFAVEYLGIYSSVTFVEPRALTKPDTNYRFSVTSSANAGPGSLLITAFLLVLHICFLDSRDIHIKNIQVTMKPSKQRELVPLSLSIKFYTIWILDTRPSDEGYVTLPRDQDGHIFPMSCRLENVFHPFYEE